jgi:predicted GNAT family N-acyltransferase
MFAVRITDWRRDERKLRAVRHAVFVVEQRVPESLEWDAIDAESVHAVAEDSTGEPLDCGRLLPDGHIGRMAVLAAWRNRGVGAALLEGLIAVARERGDAHLRLNAQTHAMPFYARFRFLPAGPEFEEAGIPHQAMERQLR